MELYTNQLRNAKYKTQRKRKRKKKETDKTVLYQCTDIFTFDIETTSAWIDFNGNIIPYRTGEMTEYWNELEPLALPYIWQFSFNEKVYYGREFIDFNNVLKDLPTEPKIIIWVHNLSYEFQFLNNILTWKEVFARSTHRPIKAIPNEYPNIEFRCSYMLTRLSVDSWGKQIGLPKMSGDLDYEKIRTPLTPLTDKEMKYCERDCEVVYAGIKKYVQQYENVHNIPLTQTGTVRRVVKDKLTQDLDYVRKIKKLVPISPMEYKRLQTVFAGGYTHASRMYSGQVIRGIIEHYDFASSYPTQMLAHKYPMSRWAYLPSKEMPSEETFDDYAYIFVLKFRRLNCIKINTYIQASKSFGKKIKFDNGRILSAEEIELTITEQDWLTIKESYEWEEMTVLEQYKAKKEYLPKPFLEYILELYKNKTELKDVEGMEDLYMQSKQYINSLFGMSVTAIVQSDVKYINNEWVQTPLTLEMIQKRLKRLSDFHDREKRYFLSYAWGCWVTAYARRMLWKCILSVDSEVLYADTDSIFLRGTHDFRWFNEYITNKLKISCEENELDFEATRPKTKKGKAKPLGIFDKEDDCTEFITLGAKRYVERRKSDGELHLTVSGINKEAVELLEDDISNFTDGFNFDKDAPCVKKRLLTYIKSQRPIRFPDGYLCVYMYGINMRRTGYLLTMTDEYKNLINYRNMTLDDLPEHIEIAMRGMWSI